MKHLHIKHLTTHQSLITLLAVFLFLMPAPGVPPTLAAAQATHPQLDTYESWLREAFAAAQRGDRLGLEEIAPALIETSSVQLPDGTRLRVDNTWLQQAMNEPDADLEQIATRLGALIDALAQPESTVPDDAQERLNAMLNRPPFQTPDDSRNSLLSQFLDWLGRLLERLFRPLGDVGSGPANVAGWLFAALGGVLVVGVLVYLLLGMRRSFRGEANLTDEEHEANLTSAGAMQQAQSLVRGGDYRTAVRYLYLSSLLLLDERGLLRYDRALTNHEYLQQLTNPELRRQLSPIVETFDRVWYGYLPLTDNDFNTYQQQVETLRKVRKE
jgi:hypothetical protein